MIRRILEFLLCLLLANITLFLKEKKIIDEKIETFEMFLKSDCVEGVLADEVTIVFDYTQIENYLDIHFENYVLDKTSQKGFSLEIEIKKGLLNEKINESFYIEEGELYDG